MATSVTLDVLLSECATSGWLLNNLYQHDTYTWRCNLRTATHYTSYGHGPTAWAALDAAMQAIELAQSLPETTTHAAIDSTPIPDLLAFLTNSPQAANLHPSLPTITRRL